MVKAQQVNMSGGNGGGEAGGGAYEARGGAWNCGWEDIGAKNWGMDHSFIHPF